MLFKPESTLLILMTYAIFETKTILPISFVTNTIIYLISLFTLI